ncbi:MAG: PEPxxWA-CTERM sorting domain-containing protein, partial [Caulobacteraceae bacterium]|nr:PEPxxWA-CTERM sorting domain-containing protein [Caulobacteraceae bacterium]
DNFYGSTSGDPYDNNLNQLFVNAATFAAKSGHGYVGEFNGAVMAMDSNSAGFASIGLLQGSADAVHGYGPQFTYGVGPIGAGNPIDAGVTFPFTDNDDTTFLTDITGANSGNIVDVYTSSGIDGEPAVLANSYVISGGGGAPEPSAWALMILGVGGAGYALRRKNVGYSFGGVSAA